MSDARADVPAWETVIGLEVHVHLKTASKLFCACSTKFGSEPNTHICPVCSGMPGALPVINARAVTLAVKTGLALGCNINLHSVFSRKSYFYPDLPNGFQTSQLEPPICAGGLVRLDTVAGGRVNPEIRINRVHLEDDAGKCIHEDSLHSMVDLNRAGTPMVEIVTEPDLRSGAEAAAFMRQLRKLLMYMDITDGNMEEGSMRCDVNISLRPLGSKEYGTRAELKNLNSFISVQAAVEYEEERQKDILEARGSVEQETRLFDTQSGTTSVMRSKEDAPDYRYFPNPDLPPIILTQAFVDDIASSMPERPEQRQKRYMESFGLNSEEAAILTASATLADYFEAAVALQNTPRRIAGLILGELLPEAGRRGTSFDALGFTPGRMAHTVAMLEAGKVSLKVLHDLFSELLDSSADIETLAEKKGLSQVSDSGALEKAVLEAIAANTAEASDYRAGKKKLLSFFVGQVMRSTKGAGNPAMINELVKKHLGA
ncbi:MAG: Asp-tRNA(Asn)/Glu-tRNA(Gln) amidotransferase subunit GatB [Deltaproteobacteria bacterium]|nr:Asp-tRNA(Asn)/Glu-tRNA(Gln) amidotransferase subunit GatB [Deltaproteobacteria bacterium]